MTTEARHRRLVRAARALGDPTRFEMLRRIAAAGEMCCRDVVALFPVAQATVSHHLSILTAAGLLRGERRGRFTYFRVRDGALGTLTADLGRVLQPRVRPRRRAR